MSELANAIARTIAQPATAESGDIRTHIDWRDNADDVLAMPEMQAIRKALHGMAQKIAWEWGYDLGATLLDDAANPRPDWTLPASVVSWVLEGEQP